MKYLTTVKQEIIFLKILFFKNKFIGNEDNEIYKSVIQFPIMINYPHFVI